jgi:hypothetical protein
VAARHISIVWTHRDVLFRYCIPHSSIVAVPRVHIRHKVIACGPHEHVSAREGATVKQVPLADAIQEEEREQQLGDFVTDMRIAEQGVMG